ATFQGLQLNDEPAPVIGSALAARSQPRSKVPFIAAAAAVAAVAFAVWMFTKDEAERAASAASAAAAIPAPASRYAKFTTEPADSRILVNGSEGHIGTPWKVALTEGQHQVEISREGYKTWTRSIEVEAGETQNFHVVLEQLNKLDNNSSTLRVRPSPLHFEAEVDGNPVRSGTPFEMELAPGIHRIVLKKAGVAIWRHELTVAPATTYELAPTVNERRRDEPAVVRDRVAAVGPGSAAGAGSAEEDDIGLGDSGSSSGSSGSGSAGSGSSSAAGSGSAGSASGSGGSGSASSGSAGSGSGSDVSPVITPTPVTPTPAPIRPAPIVPAITQPIKQPITPPAPTGPVNVSSAAVKRLSGEAPNLRTQRMDELPKVISAKVCIDTKGTVSSVSIIQSIDQRFVKELQSTLRAWKYAPYVINGAPRAACFVVPMRTK
ncbi:MAG TPA: PEGA domain-containing protein, partial [Kofleriaceae bacterium]|nr:PEGA domain-containing protein [Kofleriaceae bacterium]